MSTTVAPQHTTTAQSAHTSGRGALRNGIDRRAALRAVGITALAGFGTAALATPAVAADHTVPYDYVAQPNFFWCGPSAVHMAITAKTGSPGLDTLAAELATTQDGTNFGAVSPVLTARIPGATYRDQWIAGNDATPDEKAVFYDRVKTNIDTGFATVCNWVVPPGSYPNGYQNGSTIYHFTTVVGYNDNRDLLIADSANFNGVGVYWVPSDRVATLCALRGYFW